jgi:hypothetical protein
VRQGGEGLAIGDLTPGGGRVVAEVFADGDGQPVAPDSPELPSIDVEVLHPAGRTERLYADV